jgi:hypothetical protein
MTSRDCSKKRGKSSVLFATDFGLIIFVGFLHFFTQFWDRSVLVIFWDFWPHSCLSFFHPLFTFFDHFSSVLSRRFCSLSDLFNFRLLPGSVTSTKSRRCQINAIPEDDRGQEHVQPRPGPRPVTTERTSVG